jgi:uncharacterized protein with PQ loop repeat
MKIELGFVLSIISALGILYNLLKVIKLDNKRSIHYTYFGMMFSMEIWNLSIILINIFFIDKINEYFYLIFFGVCFFLLFYYLQDTFYKSG